VASDRVRVQPLNDFPAACSVRSVRTPNSPRLSASSDKMRSRLLPEEMPLNQVAAVVTKWTTPPPPSPAMTLPVAESRGTCSAGASALRSPAALASFESRFQRKRSSLPEDQGADASIEFHDAHRCARERCLKPARDAKHGLD
jgi:hypothetical protein